MNPPLRNPVAGAILSLITAMMWGLLPIALKELVQQMDATTIVWTRLLAAILPLLAWLAWKSNLPALARVPRRVNVLLIVAALGLCANYFFFSYSLNFVNAETSEAVIQLTTLFLILGGVLIYKEPFVTIQKLGTLLILTGLLLFFNERLRGFVDFGDRQTVGVFIVVAAAITWTVYALLQKLLLRSYSSVQILLCIYVVSVLVLLPFIQPASLLQLDRLGLALLVFCCLNTLVGYGCFTEALALWDASKVSAMLALAPLFTIGGLKLIVWINPDYAYSDRLSWLSLVGAALLVLGSALTALAPRIRRRPVAAPEAQVAPTATE